MDNVYALLKLFGDRYIFCDDEQALLDVQMNREDMVSAYVAIMNAVDLTAKSESLTNS